MKHKKGDKVKIIDDNQLPNFELGEKVTIVMADSLSDILKYYVENPNGDGHWVSENEIEAIKKATQ